MRREVYSWMCVLAAALLPAGAARAASGADDLAVERAAPAAVGVLSARGGPVQPPPFDLAPVDGQDFVAARRDLILRLSRAQAADDAAAADAARLDLAELHLSQVLTAEARSILDAVAPDRLEPRQAARWRALDLALRVLAGGDEPLPATAPLGPDFSSWADGPFWQSLDLIRLSGPAGAGAELDLAASRLDAYSRPLREYALPRLLEAAIETAQWRLARDLAGQFDLYPALKQSESYRFLLGRAAEKGGDLIAAFDSYAAAADGRGVYAARARLALIEMGLSSETLTPDEGVLLLTAFTGDWRGDAYALRGLQRLADLLRDQGETVRSLLVLGQIVTDFTETDTASLARQQARTLIVDYYDRGVAGEIPLATFLDAHRQIARDFRYLPVFAEQAERFADRFLAAGASSVAEQEYAAVEETLALERDLEIQEVPPERLDALRLKRIEALLRGGQAAAAATLAERGIDSNLPDLVVQLGLLRARIYSDLGQAEPVLATAGAGAGTDHRRLLAEAHFTRGEWTAAKALYSALWEELGADLPFTDALRLLLAAHRSGDAALVARLARAVPDLAAIPQWTTIAASLADKAPDLLPLRAASAQERLDEAEKTLDALREIEATKSQ